MSAQSSYGVTLAGTGLGTFLTYLGQIHSEDMIKTAVLSVMGAMISFAVSLGMRWIQKRVKNRGKG